MFTALLNTSCLRLLRVGAAALLALGTSQAALATNVSLGGNFLQDDNTWRFELTLTGTGSVTATSIGFAGGSTFGGANLPAGGFDTVMYLYASTGEMLAQSDDALDAAVDPLTGLALDAGFTTAPLAAGIYTLVLTQADNYALGFSLSDGFARAGAGNFTADFGCSNGSFCDYMGNNRSSAWAVNFSGDTLAAVARVPEPASLALLLAAGGALWATGRRRTTATTRLGMPVPTTA